MGAEERNENLGAAISILPRADHEASFAFCRGSGQRHSTLSPVLLGARNPVQRSPNSSEQDCDGRTTSCDIELDRSRVITEVSFLHCLHLNVLTH